MSICRCNPSGEVLPSHYRMVGKLRKGHETIILVTLTRYLFCLNFLVVSPLDFRKGICSFVLVHNTCILQPRGDYCTDARVWSHMYVHSALCIYSADVIFKTTKLVHSICIHVFVSYKGAYSEMGCIQDFFSSFDRLIDRV